MSMSKIEYSGLWKYEKLSPLNYYSWLKQFKPLVKSEGHYYLLEHKTFQEWFAHEFPKTTLQKQHSASQAKI